MIKDEKIAVMDTVDAAHRRVAEKVAEVLMVRNRIIL